MQLPTIVCPFANVSFHSAFPSFEIYEQFTAIYKFNVKWVNKINK